MNEHTPESNREEPQARLTALLLGELPDEQAAALRRDIEHDAELAKLYRQLEKTIVLVRETEAPSEFKEPAAPLRLSEERRQKLLAHFKTVAPKEFARPRKREIHWAVPLCAAAAVIAFLGMTFLVICRSEHNAFMSSSKREVDYLSERLADEDAKNADALFTERRPTAAAATPPNEWNGQHYLVAGEPSAPAPEATKLGVSNGILPAVSLSLGVQAQAASNVYSLNIVGYGNVPTPKGAEDFHANNIVLPPSAEWASAAITPKNATATPEHGKLSAGTVTGTTDQATAKKGANGNIILPAAALAAAVQANPASNLYAPNIVGYTDVPTPQGYTFHSNPFETATNGVAADAISNPPVTLAYNTEKRTPIALPDLQPASPTRPEESSVTLSSTNYITFDDSSTRHQVASASPQATTAPTVSGDPAWTGVLNRPDSPHSTSNQFIARYAYASPDFTTQQLAQLAEKMQDYSLSGKPAEAQKSPEPAPSIAPVTGLPIPAAGSAEALAANDREKETQLRSLTIRLGNTNEFERGMESVITLPAGGRPVGGAIEVPRQRTTEGTPQDKLRLLAHSLGVDLNTSSGESLSYNEGDGTITVRAKPQDLDLIGSAVRAMDSKPPEVNIAAKFAEVTPTDSTPQQAAGTTMGGTANKAAGITAADIQGIIDPSTGLPITLEAARAQGLHNSWHTPIDPSTGLPVPTAPAEPIAATPPPPSANPQGADKDRSDLFNRKGVKGVATQGATDGTNATPVQSPPLLGDVPVVGSLSRSTSAPVAWASLDGTTNNAVVFAAVPQSKTAKDKTSAGGEFRFYYDINRNPLGATNVQKLDEWSFSGATNTPNVGELGPTLAANKGDELAHYRAPAPSNTPQLERKKQPSAQALGFSGPVVTFATEPKAVDEAVLRQANRISIEARGEKENAARARNLGDKLAEKDRKITLTGNTSIAGEPMALLKANTPGAATQTDIAGLTERKMADFYDPYFIQTEYELIRSEIILGKVAKDLDLARRWGAKRSDGQPLKFWETLKLLKESVDVHAVKNTELLDIKVKDQDAQEAADIANAIAKTFVDFRQEKRRQLSENGITALQAYLDKQEADVNSRMDDAKKMDIDEAKKNQPYWEARRKLDELVRFRQLLQTKLEQEKIKSGPVSVVEVAQTPTKTSSSLWQRLRGENDYVADARVRVEHDQTDIAGANLQAQLYKQQEEVLAAQKEVERLKPTVATKPAAAPAAPRPAPSADAPVPQPEIQTRDNAFSTFSMNVSDVSFKLAAASLEKGMLPEPASVRSEEFINAFDYRDPEAPPGVPVAFAYDRARYPFTQNRDLLRFSIKTAAEGREPGRPLNLVLLLDTSGSMERADRVRTIHEALRVLAAQLTPHDVFSVVTFARTPRLWVDGIPGHQAGKAAQEVGNITPEGGTNLEEAMNLAYQTALRHYLANGVNRVVLLTDGAANLGNVDPATLKQKVEANRKQGISLDCFGVGREGYNDDLLELLTRDGNGRYGFINTPEEAATDFAGQLAGALRVAAADVKVQVEFNPARVTAYRQIGYAKHQLTKEQFRDNTVAAAQLAAAESGNALYTVEVNPRGEGPLCTVRVRYRVPATDEYHEHEWAVPYTGNAPAIEQSAPAMRLAATAAAFSEWLAASPYAADVTPERLLGYLSGVPEICGADARPKKLEWMLRQAHSIEGKR